MKKFLAIVIVLIIVAAGVWYLYSHLQAAPNTPVATGPTLTLAEMETATGNAIATNANGAALAAFGDLNGDGAGDAAVIIPNTANGVGTILEVYFLGTSSSLAGNNQPVLVATTSDLRVPTANDGQLGIGAELNPITGIAITNGAVMVSGQVATTSSTELALAPSTIQYGLVGGVLVQNSPGLSIPAVPSGTVAIGSSESWGTYTDTADAVQFDYPSGVVNASTKASDIKNIKSYLPIDPNAKAVLTLPASQYPASTTVHDVAVVVSATPAPDFPTCVNNAEGGYESAPVLTPILPPNPGATAALNFYQLPGVTGGGCWAGGCAFGTLFVAYQNGMCYQFGLQAAVTDPGNVASSQAEFQQMDKNNQVFESRLAALFYQILSTVQFQ